MAKYEYYDSFAEILNIDKRAKSKEEYEKDFIAFLSMLSEFTVKNQISWERAAYNSPDIKSHNLNNTGQKFAVCVFNKSMHSSSRIVYSYITDTDIHNGYNKQYYSAPTGHNRYRLKIIIKDDVYDLSLKQTEYSKDISNAFNKLNLAVEDAISTMVPIKTVITQLNLITNKFNKVDSNQINLSFCNGDLNDDE